MRQTLAVISALCLGTSAWADEPSAPPPSPIVGEEAPAPSPAPAPADEAPPPEAASASAPAPAPAPAKPPAARARASAPPAATGPVAPKKQLGITLDLGAFDGAQVGVQYTPISFVRVHASVGHNGISPGVRAGVTLAPFEFAVTPVLTLEAGTFAEGDATVVLTTAGLQPPPGSDVRLGYHYYSAQVGLEIGTAQAFQFFIKAGLSQLNGDLHGLSDLLGDPTLELGPTHLRVPVPSVKLGIIVHLF